MNRKSSIHIEKGNLGYCFHNTRQKPTANSIFLDEKNEYDNDALKAIEIYRNELKKRELAYTKRTGKKLHKNTITHLSAIVNLDERHTIDDLKKVAEYLEQTLGTKVFQIAVHRDEGFINEETGEKHINYHGHIEMLGLDDQGNSVRRKLTKSYLINLQSKVAEILGMQRGINYTKERKKRPKRLGTYEYKEHAKRKTRELKPLLQENKQLKKENEELKITKKQLEKEISDLRKKMIEFNKKLEQKEFTQEDYKYLSTLKKELKANNLKEIYIKLIAFDKSVKEKMFKFKKYKKYLEEENKKLKNKLLQSENRVQELEEENKRLKKQLELVKNSLQNVNEYTKETAKITSKTQNIDIKNYFVYGLSEAQDNFNCNVKLITSNNEEHNYSTFLPSNIHQIKKAVVKNEKYELIDNLEENTIYVTNFSNEKEDVIEMLLNSINLFLKKGAKLEDLTYKTKSPERKKIFEELKNTLLQQDYNLKKLEQQTQTPKTGFKLKK